MASSSSSLPAPRYIHAFPAKLIRFPRRGEGLESNLLVLLPRSLAIPSMGPSFDQVSLWWMVKMNMKAYERRIDAKRSVSVAMNFPRRRWWDTQRRTRMTGGSVATCYCSRFFPSPLLPSLSLIVSTNRKVENYYGSKSIRLPRVIGVSCPSRNSLLTYSRLYEREKLRLFDRSPNRSVEISNFFESEISIEQSCFFFSFFFFFSFLVRKFESNNNDRFEIISLLIKFFRSDRGEERRKEERKKNNFPRVIESSWHGG